jgi:hypothetical protein
MKRVGCPMKKRETTIVVVCRTDGEPSTSEARLLLSHLVVEGLRSQWFSTRHWFGVKSLVLTLGLGQG